MTYCKPIAVIITVLMKSCCTYISDCGIIAVLGGCMYGDSIDNGKLRKRDGKSNPLILRTTSTLFLSSPFACRQGGRHTTGSAYFSLPVAFPSAILSTVALGENNCLTEFVKLIGYNRTAIALQSISREGGDCGARPIQWIAVGY